MVLDFRINEEGFHKIGLLHCDFFTRKRLDTKLDIKSLFLLA